MKRFKVTASSSRASKEFQEVLNEIKERDYYDVTTDNVSYAAWLDEELFLHYIYAKDVERSYDEYDGIVEDILDFCQNFVDPEDMDKYIEYAKKFNMMEAIIRNGIL